MPQDKPAPLATARGGSSTSTSSASDAGSKRPAQQQTQQQSQGRSGGGGGGGKAYQGNNVSHRKTDDGSASDSNAHLKKKHAEELKSLQEVFADWSVDDLLNAFLESNSDVTLTISRITEGHIDQWSTVNKKPVEKKKGGAGGAAEAWPQGDSGARGPRRDEHRERSDRVGERSDRGGDRGERGGDRSDRPPRKDGAKPPRPVNGAQSSGSRSGRAGGSDAAAPADLATDDWDATPKTDWTDTTSIPAPLATAVAAPASSTPATSTAASSATDATKSAASPANAKSRNAASSAPAPSKSATTNTSGVTPGKSWSAVASAGNQAALAAQQAVAATSAPLPPAKPAPVAAPVAAPQPAPVQPAAHYPTPVPPQQPAPIAPQEPTPVPAAVQQPAAHVQQPAAPGPAAATGARPRPMVPSASLALAAAQQAALQQALAQQGNDNALLAAEPISNVAVSAAPVSSVPSAIAPTFGDAPSAGPIGSAVGRPAAPSRAIGAPRRPGRREEETEAVGVVMPSTAFDAHLDVSFGSLAFTSNDDTDSSIAPPASAATQQTALPAIAPQSNVAPAAQAKPERSVAAPGFGGAGLDGGVSGYPQFQQGVPFGMGGAPAYGVYDELAMQRQQGLYYSEYQTKFAGTPEVSTVTPPPAVPGAPSIGGAAGQTVPPGGMPYGAVPQYPYYHPQQYGMYYPPSQPTYHGNYKGYSPSSVPSVPPAKPGGQGFDYPASQYAQDEYYGGGGGGGYSKPAYGGGGYNQGGPPPQQSQRWNGQQSRGPKTGVPNAGVPGNAPIDQGLGYNKPQGSFDRQPFYGSAGGQPAPQQPPQSQSYGYGNQNNNMRYSWQQQQQQP